MTSTFNIKTTTVYWIEKIKKNVLKLVFTEMA